MSSRRYSYTLVILIFLAIALIILRMQLPTMVEDYLNGKLADMGDYQGEITDVDMHLWRGAYSVNQLEISRKDQPSVVFFKADTIAVSWSALLQDKVVANVDLIDAQIHLFDTASEDKTKPGSTWRQKVQEILPIEIDQLNSKIGEFI